ncbi:hypothetical protein GDO86_011670 [Hymenochirus boettgeri]|uniref:Uncharacterized protein n=1 Tax=Hymenochirus boettgeri TaxID=247094 RepID=A0A8T2JF71_9PIPI|nr:hypothetical protein GDO86_011670 [Hymenochirus boettgeri]
MEAQISFLQGQLNDLEAMCKYCAKIMNTHLGHIQDVVLEEKLEKEDKIQVSLAVLKQIKDILKGTLRFNQSLLEAEENEEILITDDHYCSNMLRKNDVDFLKEKEEEPRPDQATAKNSGNANSRHSDDYILIPREEDDNCVASSLDLKQNDASQEHEDPAKRMQIPAHSLMAFSDPLTSRSTSCNSSPDDDSSNNSKDSDFTIVSPLDI